MLRIANRDWRRPQGLRVPVASCNPIKSAIGCILGLRKQNPKSNMSLDIEDDIDSLATIRVRVCFVQGDEESIL